MPFRCTDGPYINNEEPSLDELLAEPMVQLLMARDGIEEATVRLLAKALLNNPARGHERGVRRGVVPQRSLDSVDRADEKDRRDRR
jgi:hypothetical protein